MRQNALKNILFITLITGLLSISNSCSLLKPSRVKQAEKLEKEQMKEAEEAYELLKEQHKNRQTAKTKERMEMTKLRSEYNNRSKKRPSFWKRIFGKRSKYKKP